AVWASMGWPCDTCGSWFLLSSLGSGRRGRLESRYHIHLREILVNDLENDRQVFARGRPPEHGRSPAAAARDSGFVPVGDHFFRLRDRDAVLGNMLNVSIRILGQK